MENIRYFPISKYKIFFNGEYKIFLAKSLK